MSAVQRACAKRSETFAEPEQATELYSPIIHWLPESRAAFAEGMAALMREGNTKIFANKAFTRDLIKNGDYKAALERFNAPLREWRDDFDKCASIPRFMRFVLLIEYDGDRQRLKLPEHAREEASVEAS